MLHLISHINILPATANFIDDIFESFNNWISKHLCHAVDFLLENADLIYRACVKRAVGLFSMDPSSFSAEGYSYVSSLANGAFYTLGTTLVAVFFLIGFFSESVDVKNEMRLETLLKGAIKFSVAEFFVLNSLKISKSLFGLVASLVGGDALADASFYPQALADILGANDITMSLEYGLGIFFFGLLAAIVIIVCGIILLYIAYSRFFKIMVILPYGVLANSTLAGSHTLRHTAVSYWKHLLGVILEAVTIIMAIGISAKIFASGTLSFFVYADYSDTTAYAVCSIMEMTLVVLITAGVVKSAGTLTNKALGL